MDEQQPSKVQLYKKKLLLKVLGLFLVSMLVIIERIFYEIIVTREPALLSSLQQALGLVDGQGAEVLPGTIYSFLPSLLSFISIYRVQMLLLTHLFVTLYISIDALVASKLILTTWLGYFLVSVLQLFYTGSRPFWASSEVLASHCVPSYAHPSIEIFTVLFLVFYGGRVGARWWAQWSWRLSRWGILLIGVMAVITKYLTGQVFILGVGMGVVIFGIYYSLLVFFQDSVQTLIKRSTVMTIDSKKYTFYWLLYLFLAQTAALIVYSSSEQFLSIDWIQNFMNCLILKDQMQELPFDEVIGPWYTFLQTTVVFALVGAVFGIARTFRIMKNYEWWKGSTKDRLIRAAIANLLIIPSWMFVIFLQGQNAPKSWIRNIGLNAFFVDSLHFFMLYLVLLGVLPQVLQRWGLEGEKGELLIQSNQQDKLAN